MRALTQPRPRPWGREPPARGERRQSSSLRLAPEGFSITISETTHPFQEKEKKRSSLTFQETPEAGTQKIKCAGPHPAAAAGRQMTSHADGRPLRR